VLVEYCLTLSSFVVFGLVGDEPTREPLRRQVELIEFFKGDALPWSYQGVFLGTFRQSSLAPRSKS
jgi:hypothetical protein